MSFEKYVLDGKVAVLYSPNYGAGWSTWQDINYKEGILFDSEIVKAVINKDFELAAKIAELKYCAYTGGGAKDLKIEWLPIGTKFIIDEYDGYESITLIKDVKYFTA